MMSSTSYRSSYAGWGAAPSSADVATLFSKDVEMEIAGDDGILRWIGKQSGRRAIAQFVEDSRMIIERRRFEVYDILGSPNLWFDSWYGVTSWDFIALACSDR